MSDQSLENLNIMANLLQIATFMMTLGEASNDRLMKELQHQNKDFLQQILDNQKVILNNLERIKK